MQVPIPLLEHRDKPPGRPEKLLTTFLVPNKKQVDQHLEVNQYDQKVWQ